MALSPQEIIAAYCEAWNVPSEGARRKLLEKSWSDDGTYTDPRTELSGRGALLEHISHVHAGRPGSRIVMTSGIDVHHGLLRFAWTLIDPQGVVLVEGIDFGELGADGRLRRIIGFFGPLPPA